MQEEFCAKFIQFELFAIQAFCASVYMREKVVNGPSRDGSLLVNRFCEQFAY
jgi:hypothetical protein